MARHEPNQRLAALLAEARWSGAELARAVNTLGAAQGLKLRYDRTSVAHWLTGSRPRQPVADLAAAALSRRCNRLISAEETGLLQAPQTLAPLSHHSHEKGDAVHRLASLCRAEADPVRRAVLSASVYNLATATSVLEWKTKPMPPPRLRGTGFQPTPLDVERLQDMVRLFAELTEQYGGAHARSSLAAYLADDVSSVLSAPAAQDVRRELFVSAAQLTHILARMTNDAGQAGLAQQYYTVALSVAQEAGAPSLYAVTLRAMSLQAVCLGYPQQAWELADAAVDIAGPHAQPATRSFLLSQRAFAQACHQHHRRAALADLMAAEKAHEHASSPAGPFTAYPRAGLDYQRAQTFLVLGEARQATQALVSAVNTRPENQHRTSAITHARLAETLLHAGHLENACQHWHTFLDHYARLRSEHATQAFHQLRRTLRPYQHERHATAVLRRAQALQHASLL
ncbi:hypothetical protein QWM81_12705 [Streptomyces ficellus]|uniref:Transcriptional regulator n=1 Tax=Streptomyces ficellus TaxID=1977088 RepID=A0ABT7Z5X1_9ACTN|nr:hypothetical protein [Streptomyces ficellus]MDN3294898.1 hypothetical protein [Streptomyces ficellus]